MDNPDRAISLFNLNLYLPNIYFFIDAFSKESLKLQIS